GLPAVRVGRTGARGEGLRAAGVRILGGGAGPRVARRRRGGIGAVGVGIVRVERGIRGGSPLLGLRRGVGGAGLGAVRVVRIRSLAHVSFFGTGRRHPASG